MNSDGMADFQIGSETVARQHSVDGRLCKLGESRVDSHQSRTAAVVYIRIAMGSKVADSHRIGAEAAVAARTGYSYSGGQPNADRVP